MRIAILPTAVVLFFGLIPIRAQSPSPSAYAEAITADVLINAFQENPIAADAKYMGHRMSVGGVVDKVGMDKSKNPYVILRPIKQKASGSIKCKFAPALAPRIAQLRHGAPAGVKGTVVSAGQGKVGLNDCTL